MGRGQAIYNESLTPPETEPWRIYKSAKALLQTEQCGVWDVFVESEENMSCADLFLGFYETCMQSRKLCCAAQDAENMKKVNCEC